MEFNVSGETMSQRSSQFRGLGVHVNKLRQSARDIEIVKCVATT